MANALIGHTGFVGSNLLNQQNFDDCYNSSTISQIENKSYDKIICAGVPAVKWMANREPVQDRENIQGLMAQLKTVKADKFILISTIDVYPNPVNVDENTVIDLEACHAYGKHRLELEKFIRDEFDAIIIRLPGLFGTGLKKNIIYDFLNDNNIEDINPNSSFQFYSLNHLSADIETARKHNLEILNISTEPTSVQEIAEVCLGQKLANTIDLPGIEYDFKSCFAQRFGGNNGYLYSKAQVLSDLKAYVKNP